MHLLAWTNLSQLGQRDLIVFTRDVFTRKFLPLATILSSSHTQTTVLLLSFILHLTAMPLYLPFPLRRGTIALQPTLFCHLILTQFKGQPLESSLCSLGWGRWSSVSSLVETTLMIVKPWIWEVRNTVFQPRNPKTCHCVSNTAIIQNSFFF